eukprot:CAMPEP_0177747200 /NCGR_PEP_ID=MMETSP0484_2-20121128/31274_1 /TAXON_ID=354590 /ORGANISM="Rhodomonas lens, Strain RHODO" /LENGTH=158 /DNA_ID=CAMNT_0019261997 /DNA_START=54 /DNA_END=530 /DNA_ORIENTATION=+
MRAAASEGFAEKEVPPDTENLSLPTQQGHTTKHASACTAHSIAMSVAFPHACSATTTSHASSLYSSMSPSTPRTLSILAATARRCRSSMQRAFMSTPTKVQCGRRAARGSVMLPLPLPKSTTVGAVLFLFSLATFKAFSRAEAGSDEDGRGSMAESMR